MTPPVTILKPFLSTARPSPRCQLVMEGPKAGAVQLSVPRMTAALCLHTVSGRQEIYLY